MEWTPAIISVKQVFAVTIKQLPLYLLSALGHLNHRNGKEVEQWSRLLRHEWAQRDWRRKIIVASFSQEEQSLTVSYWFWQNLKSPTVVEGRLARPRQLLQQFRHYFGIPVSLVKLLHCFHLLTLLLRFQIYLCQVFCVKKNKEIKRGKKTKQTVIGQKDFHRGNISCPVTENCELKVSPDDQAASN